MKVKEVMTPDPIALPVTATVQEAARVMRDSDVGPVIVLEGDQPCGIVTDRDITVRAVADEQDLATLTLGDICSKDLVSVQPEAEVEEALLLMQEKAVRRVAVVDGGRAVGIVSMGDLAIGTNEDLDQAITEISSAPPNS
jgi:CBS domain-containing protein